MMGQLVPVGHLRLHSNLVIHQKNCPTKWGPSNKKWRCEAFRIKYKNGCSAMIPSQTLTTLHVHKFNNAKGIPLANGINLLNLHLANKAESLLANSKHDILQWKQDTWAELCQVTLAKQTLSKRHKSREVQKIEISTFETIKASHMLAQEEVMESLCLTRTC